MKQKGTEWTDHKGKRIPTYAINPVAKTEERHSQKIAAAALRAEKHLARLVELARAAHKDVYKAKVKDAEIKGNKTPSEGMTISSFDGTIEVKVTKPESMHFDNTYTNLVKEKFNEYFEAVSGDNEELLFMKDLVNDLLYTSGGRIDNNKVLKLRKYRDRLSGNRKVSAKGKLFIQAVDLFDKAVKTKPGNTGIYVRVMDENEKMRRVALKYTDI